MSLLQAVATIGVVCGIGYATLYKADTKRGPTTEQRIARIPDRFLSLMMVAFGSVTIMALLFDAPDTFLESVESNREKATSVGSVFRVVGAATADSVFSR